VIIRFASGDILRRIDVSWADIFCHILGHFAVEMTYLVAVFDSMGPNMRAKAGFFLNGDKNCRPKSPSRYTLVMEWLDKATIFVVGLAVADTGLC